MGCQRCGAVVPDARNGQTRKWCSENCRKRAADDRARGRCVDCETPLAAGSAWTGGTRCRPCYDQREAAAYEERLQNFVAMYNEGMPLREIARRLGWGENSRPPYLTDAHRRGLIGYRHRGYGEAA
jgi:hypothetical protein